MDRCAIKSLEYNIVWHCTNSCVACSHMSPINPKRFVSIGTFRNSIRTAAKLLKAVKFALAGGEPLLHPELPELIAIAKASKVAPEIQVITNGVLLNRMTDKFWNAPFDTLRISRYPEQVSDIQWKAWKKKTKRHNKRFFGGLSAKFYKPLVPEPSSPEETLEKFKNCPWKDHCTTLEGDMLYLCPQGLFYPYHFPEICEDRDGLNLRNCTAKNVSEFMNRVEPLESCKKCHYEEYVPWKQVSRQRWLKESTHYA